MSFFETDKEFEFNAYLNTLEADKQKQLNKIVYDVLNKAFAHKMKSFPSKFKKKLSGIFSDITPKQFLISITLTLMNIDVVCVGDCLIMTLKSYQ